MDHLSDVALHQLNVVAGEIIDTLEAEGHAIADATQHHDAFQNGRGPTSALERALVKAAATQGARKAGMNPESARGGLDLVAFDNLTERRFRLKVATYRDGVPDILVGESSHLVTNPQEPESLYTTVRWVLCFQTDDDNAIVEIFAAEVIGYSGDGPVHLELGPLQYLSPITEPDGFAPGDDNDLGGFDEGTAEGNQDAV